jgi:Na+/pantothenate symporter
VEEFVKPTSATAAMMSTILSAVCPLETAVIASTESLYLLARQREREKKDARKLGDFKGLFLFVVTLEVTLLQDTSGNRRVQMVWRTVTPLHPTQTGQL